MIHDNLKPKKQVLTLEEAAARLGVSYNTAIEWIHAGTLPAFKFPGRRSWSVDEDDLVAMIESAKENTQNHRNVGTKYGTKGVAPARKTSGPIPMDWYEKYR